MSQLSRAEGSNVLRLQREAAAILTAAGVCDPGRDARYLLAHLLNIEPGEVPARTNQLVSQNDAARFRNWIAQRAGGKPVHRIMGARDFYGRSFALNAACLEPRPETELLVERVLADHQKAGAVQFAEVGVGSGVISVTLLCEMILANAVGTDISQGAITATQQNAARLDVLERLELRCADCLDGVDGIFDFIVSNPPYIATGDLAGLSKEVREHDPVTALDGGIGGLDMYDRLLKDAPHLLKDGGRLYLETGHDQHRDICTIAVENGWGVVSCHLDLSGLERIVVLEWPRASMAVGRGSSDTVKGQERKDLELPQ